MGGIRPIINTSFKLKPAPESSSINLIELLGEDYKAYVPGQLLTGMGKMKIANLIKRKRIARGSYYYILEIDDKIRVTDRFEIY